MTKAILLVLFITLCALPQAHAESIAEWQDAELSTAIYGHQVGVKATRAGDHLARLTVTIDRRDGSVPEKEISKQEQPHLGTLKFHYWTKDLEQFYVSMEFGPMNSLHEGTPPYTIYFLFKDGQYLRQEKVTIVRADLKTIEPLPPPDRQ